MNLVCSSKQAEYGTPNKKGPLIVVDYQNLLCSVKLTPFQMKYTDLAPVPKNLYEVTFDLLKVRLGSKVSLSKFYGPGPRMKSNKCHCFRCI